MPGELRTITAGGDVEGDCWGATSCGNCTNTRTVSVAARRNIGVALPAVTRLPRSMVREVMVPANGAVTLGKQLEIGEPLHVPDFSRDGGLRDVDVGVTEQRPRPGLFEVGLRRDAGLGEPTRAMSLLTWRARGWPCLSFWRPEPGEARASLRSFPRLSRVLISASS